MPTNQLHPVYHSLSFQAGSRIDVNRRLPSDLDDVDMDEFLDQLSEPQKFAERICPVSTVIGSEIVRGKNWQEMMSKSYRVFLRMFTSISYYVRQAMIEKFDERGLVPFMSAVVEPDLLHHTVEQDYEQGENSYATLMEFYRTGLVAPCATSPFHAILPLLDNDFDRRLCIRMGLIYYWPILKEYHSYLKTVHGEQRFVVLFWLPECGYSSAVVKILHQEFMAMAKADKIHDAHLVLLLDSQQAMDRDNDVLMKSWNCIRVSDKDFISVLFRDRAFSDWVTYSNPSVKKLIDRTIAKVDSELNERDVDYCWSHCEDIESLAFSSKSSLNFEQKIVKLTQLSYLAVSPDVFVRRKLSRKFGLAEQEPMEVRLKENTGWNDWHTSVSLGRWQGVLDSNSPFKLVDEHRPYTRRTRTGKVQEIGPQCWKIAYNQARANCTRVIKGDPETLKGGFIGVLAEICGAKDETIVRRNVMEFLVHYSHAYWREHFLQHHEMSEADVHVQELVRKHLMRDVRKRPKDEDCAMAGVAAVGFYWALDAHDGSATHWENMDQRALYQSVTMLTLSMSCLMHILRWKKRQAEEKQVYELLKTELLDFRAGFLRYRLADYGVTEQEWVEALKPAVDESPLNIVERAARRTAARHLRPLGYRKDFSKDDENITANCGHIWNAEVENSNFKWENKLYCGLREE